MGRQSCKGLSEYHLSPYMYAMNMTFMDLVLPRILAGEHIGKTELAFLGHGGLCRDRPECLYPHCPFGKGF